MEFVSLAALVQTLDRLEELFEDPTTAPLVQRFKSAEYLRKLILRDFFRHGFDGSGDDGGSCIDGRLCATWPCCTPCWWWTLSGVCTRLVCNLLHCAARFAPCLEFGARGRAHRDRRNMRLSNHARPHFRRPPHICLELVLPAGKEGIL